MGNTLDKPITRKDTISGSINSFNEPGSIPTNASKKKAMKGYSISQEIESIPFGLSSCQGWRMHQEDTSFCMPELRIPAEQNNSSISHDADEVGKTVEISTILPGHSLFGLFDGHGGDFAAKFASAKFVGILYAQEAFQEYCRIYEEKDSHLKPKKRGNKAKIHTNTDSQDKLPRELLQIALRKSFLEVDRQMLEQMNQLKDSSAYAGQQEEQGYSLMDSGTAAIVVLLTPDSIICSNAGDCRSTLSQKDKSRSHHRKMMYNVVPLSHDHKPDDPEEEKRILQIGGTVTSGRVDGDLALSRALGDFHFKHTNSVLSYDRDDKCSNDVSLSNELFVYPDEQKVSPLPEIITLDRDLSKDCFIVAACDGIWDVMTSQECTDIISQIFQEGESDVGLVAEEVSSTIFDWNSCIVFIHFLLTYGFLVPD